MDIERFRDQDILLTFEEAAQFLRVSRATMYRLLDTGQLIGHRVGRGWRFYKTDLHAFVTSHTTLEKGESLLPPPGEPPTKAPAE